MCAEDGEHSVGNALRRQAGHEVPEIVDADPLLSTIFAIARDVYPALLLPPLRDPFASAALVTPAHRIVMSAVMEHPAASRFAEAVRDDPLFEMLGDGTAPPFFMFAAGTGAAVDLDALPAAVIGAAAARSRLLDAQFSLGGLVAQLRAVLADLRAIGRGERIRVPVATSVQGIEVQPAVKFDLPWGVLRSMDQSTLNAIGDAFPAQGAAFVTTIECDVAVGDASAPEGPPTPRQSAMRAFNTTLDERVEKLALTLLLANHNPRVAGVVTRVVAITPLFGVGWGAVGRATEPGPAQQRALTTQSAAALTEAAALVDLRYAPTLAIPTRRLTSALSVRHDLEDSLVDAVVAWESLFAGTDAGELTFRIAAAMAWLLGATVEDRLRLHREISSLYGVRSQILHRGRAGRDLTAERDRAVELGVQAITALLRDHPDLVADENRGKKLIMRGEMPDASN
ncbi:hypothetical protein DSM104299_05272 [Baekduia alba]|nr:hypothetical protein DSM104299_05272 [Baekduia alba]